jgi:hypothetical protein
MDNLAHWGAGYFSAEVVLAYFQADRKRLTQPSKIQRELLVGLLLHRFFEEEQREQLLIGFPLKASAVPNNPGIGFTISELITRSDVRDDIDVDVLLGNKDIALRFQVARVVSKVHTKGRKTLAQVLRDKVAKNVGDSHLYLVISVEEETKMSGEELAPILLGSEMPFAGVFLVGKRSKLPGEFSCLQMYPQFRELPARSIPIYL